MSGVVSSDEGLGKWLRKISGQLGSAEVVHVGFLEGSTAGWNGPRPMKPRKAYASAASYKRAKENYRAATNTGAISQQPAAYIASIMEYGDPGHNIPPRPFFSNMIAEKSSTWSVLVAESLLHHGYDARTALEAVGNVIARQLQLSIVDGNFKELADATKARKGFDTPLLDSKNMLRAVDYTVI